MLTDGRATEHHGGGTIGESAGKASEVREPIQLFESYGWRDAREIAENLRASLSDAGYHVWVDREHMRSDEQHFSLVLADAIKDSRIVIALLSPHSVRGLAQEDQRLSVCYNEIREASSLSRPIVPVRVQEFDGLGPFLINHISQIVWLDWHEPDGYQRGVREIINRIKGLLEGREKEYFDKHISLKATDFTAVLATARKGFTGRDWLFRRLEEWLKSNQRCYMIKGMTGSGKTAIAAELVARNPGQRILGYHFCNAAIKETVDPERFVDSLAAMLANGVAAYAKQYRDGHFADQIKGTDPQQGLVQGVLAPLYDLKMDGNFTIVVDGLDEAMATPHRETSLPELLAGALEAFPPWLKLLVTTRPHGEIEGLFPGAEVSVLGEAVENQRADLKAYVEKRLALPPLDQKIDQDERGHAARLIEDRAGGSFQYVSMVLDALGEGEMALGQVGELRAGLAELYFRLARRRFRDEAGFDDRARAVLGVLLAAREPLTRKTLAVLSGLDEPGKIWPALNALSCFIDVDPGNGPDGIWRIAHSSIREWLLSDQANVFQIDPTAGRRQLLEYCLKWRENHEPYASKHVVGHLLEAGRAAQALQAIEDGLFADRLAELKEPRFDADDSRSLTLALVGAHDGAGIARLARTANIWQRDGVAAGLQSAPEKDLGFIDGVVATLLKLSQ